jgi:photosystem II stability/assembly factor-like uncharacterized protein
MTDQIDSNHEDFLYGIACLPMPGKQRILAARSSGLYSSLDGETWELATSSLEIQDAYSATAIAVVPGRKPSARNPDDASSTQSPHHVFLGLAGGILYSQDGGNQWLSARVPKPPPVVSCFAVSPDYERDGVVLAGSLEDGVLRSADRGRSWVTWNFGLLDLAVMSLAISPNFADDETVFAGTESGLFRSSNGGRAWREVPMPAGYDPVISLAISPNFGFSGENSQTILAGTESLGLFQSDDRGKSLHRITGDGLEGMIQSVVFSPDYPVDPAILVVVEGKVLLSRDDGQSWVEIFEEITDPSPAAAFLAPDGLKTGQKAWLGLADGQVLGVFLP